MVLSSDPVPAVLESEAEGEIREIFLDLNEILLNQQIMDFRSYYCYHPKNYL